MPPKVAKSASSAKKEDAPVEKKKDLFVIEAYDPNAYFEPVTKINVLILNFNFL